MKLNAKWLAALALAMVLAAVVSRYGIAKDSDDLSVGQTAKLISSQIQQLQSLADKIKSANGADTSQLQAAFQQQREDLQSKLDNLAVFVKGNTDPNRFDSKGNLAAYLLWSQRLTSTDSQEAAQLRAALSQCRSQIVKQNAAGALRTSMPQ